MNIYSPDDEFLSTLKEWMKNNPFEIPKDAVNHLPQNGKNNGFYGFHHTEESKRKISENQKGWKHSEDSKEKIRKARSGIKRPASVGEKISNSISGEKHHMWGKKWSEEVKQKISDTKKKSPYSHNEERRKKISKAAKLREMKKRCLI